MAALPAKVSLRGALLATLLWLGLCCAICSGQQQQRRNQDSSPSTTSQSPSVKAISETTRSQQQQQQDASNSMAQEKQISRRDGGAPTTLVEQHLSQRPGNQHHPHMASLPHELTEDPEAGELFVSEDPTGFEGAGGSTASGILLDNGQTPAGAFGSAEYEADSSTDLVELPAAAHISPAAVSAAQMQAQTVQNLRLLRQSANPLQATHFNLDQRLQQQAAQQQPQQQNMMVATMQQAPNLQRPQTMQAPAISSVVTTTMASRAIQQQQQASQQQPLQVQPAMSNIAPRAFQQQVAAQAASQRGAFDQQQAGSAPGAFNVNMGADRMMIKPQQQQQQQQQFQGSTRASAAALADQEMVTESVNHELLVNSNANRHGQPQMHMNHQQGVQGSHQDLLYPSGNDFSPAARQPLAPMSQVVDHQYRGGGGGEVSSSVVGGGQAICYTPVALLIVILVTMLVTVVVCFATHVVIKHMGRHQFDLIANSKHFDSKHGSGYLKGASAGLQSAGQQRSAELQRQLDGHLGSHQYLEPDGGGKSVHANCRARDELGSCAFDNPYFRDESGGYLCDSKLAAAAHQQLAAAAAASSQQQQQQLQQANGEGQQRALAVAAASGAQPNHRQPAAPTAHDGANNTGSEHLNFIEHHISNLHSKQVTSSVKELSVLGSSLLSADLGNPAGGYTGPVVDLTSDEQRARVITDPREGDLVAVDLTGHDFIGLGFDLCGNNQEGIFVRSVLARGPARESGCIEPGDRIKCLNISFDNMTLQDACDLLNCGAPYKLRLLLEKRALAPKLVQEKQRLCAPMAAPTVVGPAMVSARRGRHHLLAGGGPPSGHHLAHHHHQHQHHHRHGAPQHAQKAPMGALAATKSYLRRIANSLMGPMGGQSASRSSGSSSSALHNYRDQFGVAASPTAFNADHHYDAYLQQQLQQQLMAMAGSTAARRRSSLANSVFSPDPAPHHPAAHLNPGYGSDGDETGDELAEATPGERRLRTSDSIMRSRLSMASADMFASSQLVNDFGAGAGTGPYSSLGYHNRNAHHRLHGPPLVDERNGAQLDLAAANKGQARPASHDHLPAEGARRLVGARHQQPIQDQHLEQSQSQPEIALPNQTGSADATTGSGAGPTAAAASEGRANERSQLLMNSMSTPTMNLLLNSGQQPQTEAADRPVESAELGDNNKTSKQAN